MKTILVLLSIALMTIGLGCAALSQYVTPAEIDQGAVDYAYEAGVADAVDYEGWANMVKAEKLKKDVDAAHNVVQLDLAQLMQKDDLTYAIHKDVVSSNLVIAQQREEMLFGETGLLSLGLSMAGMGGFAGLLGLMRKRPQDWTPAEVEATIAETTGKTTAELSAKEKQFMQLVKGVQAFLDTDPNLSHRVLKDAMDAAQDSDTRAAVAVVKATA